MIGGGANGVGIARDAVGRGLKVALVEQGDLAQATSSASSKLIHGGLRYLEQYEFRLVREALAEREALLAAAPHIITPMRFVLPHEPSQRPAWMIRTGLFLYDHLARRERLEGSKSVDLRSDMSGAVFRDGYRTAFSYADCFVDDARLVVLAALDARERGACIWTRCTFVGATVTNNLWRAVIRNLQGREDVVRARALVNAGGPWVERVQRTCSSAATDARLRMVKGSHLVVPRLYTGEHAYILQQPDRRIVFVIPYEERFSLIGTTDVPFDGDPSNVAISPEEIEYLCHAVSTYFAKPVHAETVVWSYAGVRPLYEDRSGASPSTVTRDYVFDLEVGGSRPPLLSVYGGKITTFRRLAEHALQKLEPHLPEMRGAWTHRAPLPGGDIPGGDLNKFIRDISQDYPFLPPVTVRRLARCYGTRVHNVIGDAREWSGMGEDFGFGLTSREVAYLVKFEFAHDPEDVLWRRTKLGLHGGSALARKLGDHLGGRHAQLATMGSP